MACRRARHATKAARGLVSRAQVSVKIVTEDDEMTADVIVQGDEEEVERFQKTLDMREKGMIYVKGVFDA